MAADEDEDEDEDEASGAFGASCAALCCWRFGAAAPPSCGLCAGPFRLWAKGAAAALVSFFFSCCCCCCCLLLAMSLSKGFFGLRAAADVEDDDAMLAKGLRRDMALGWMKEREREKEGREERKRKALDDGRRKKKREGGATVTVCLWKAQVLSAEEKKGGKKERGEGLRKGQLKRHCLFFHSCGSSLLA